MRKALYSITYYTTTGNLKTKLVDEDEMRNLTAKLDERIQKGRCLGYDTVFAGYTTDTIDHIFIN